MTTEDKSNPLKQLMQSVATKKITDWKIEPSVADLKADLEAAKPAHDAQASKVRKWNNLRDIKGDAAPPKISGRSSVQPKMVRRQAEWRYSALSEPLLGTDKLFQIRPATFEDTEAALQNELVLNHQFRNKLDRQKLIDDYVRSAVDDGTVILQVGWDRQTMMVKEPVPVYEYYPVQTEEQMQVFMEAVQLKQTNPRMFQNEIDPLVQEAVNYAESSNIPSPIIAVEAGLTEEEVEKVLCNKPTVVVHPFDNVIVDPSCQGDMDKAMFVVVSFETSEAELKKQKGRYTNLDAINWDAVSHTAETEHTTNTPQDFQFKDRIRKKIVAYEYWGYYDIEGTGKLTPIVATWVGDVMIRLEENPFPDKKLPFVLVPYLPIKHSAFGEADAELIEENQKIVGAIMRGTIDLLGKSANSQQGIPKNLLDPVNRDRYRRGEDYEYNPLQGNPAQFMITHKFPEIPASAIQMLQLQDMDAESLTGTKAFSGGLSGEAYGQVAAGIKGMLNAQGIREMNILRRLTSGLVKVAQKIIMMNAVWLSDVEVVRITNKNFVKDTFIEVMREDLPGNFDVIVEVSTAEIENIQAQDLAFMLQTMGPDMDPGMKYRMLSEIARLKRMPELAEELRNFKPEPSPEQQALMQEELRKLQLENAKLESEIQLNQAKAQAELMNAEAKQYSLQDELSGAKHQRDIEKQQAQARGNQTLELQKAVLAPRKQGEQAPDIEAGIGFHALSATLNNAQPSF